MSMANMDIFEQKLRENISHERRKNMDYLDYNDWKDSYERMIMAAEALYEYEREEAQLKYLEELEEKEKEKNGKRN